MHPDIKKFWEDAGYTVETDVMLPCCDIPYYLFWFILDKNGNQLRCVGQSNPYDRDSEAYEQLKEDPPCTVYFLYENRYTEQEMLRIIKLKDFL
jgi:hypothetical protein